MLAANKMICDVMGRVQEAAELIVIAFVVVEEGEEGGTSAASALHDILILSEMSSQPNKTLSHVT